ncbi:LOW QUALITY PROTEIN: endonuclease-reverse transcriptase [Elysia marginata]|uniref:Endonuclease-reverse transcriptase n=1 Tax=Elysia marginata TaxID=1093978 RepID=A0AAV4I748_9GAST|nr:LOW QUALITY PROTEIN: endonuclease-reverse transcriptase [Elysia marginata]
MGKIRVYRETDRERMRETKKTDGGREEREGEGGTEKKYRHGETNRKKQKDGERGTDGLNAGIKFPSSNLASDFKSKVLLIDRVTTTHLSEKYGIVKELTEFIFRKTSNFPGLNIGGRKFNNIRYADDTVLLTEISEALQLLAETVNKNSNDAGLEMNVKKTKKTDGGREESEGGGRSSPPKRHQSK